MLKGVFGVKLLIYLYVYVVFLTGSDRIPIHGMKAVKVLIFNLYNILTVNS